MDIQARSPALENDPFAGCDKFYQGLRARLTSKESLGMDHAAMERLLLDEGTELLRQLYQAWIDQRGSGEVAGDVVVGADEIRRPHTRLLTRNLKTVFGSVTVSRTGYSAHDADTLFPRDAELNLPAELYSLGLQRRGVDEVVKTSFDQSTAAVAKTTGAELPKRQLEESARRAVVDFDEFYRRRGAAAVGAGAQSSEILVLTTDAKGIRMRLEYLREATRKIAETHAHKMLKRLSPGEKRGRKRMAQVAGVYTIAPFIRSPENVAGDLSSVRAVPDERSALRPRPEHKRLFASIDQEPARVVEEMFQEALRRDPERSKTWAVLVDGSPSQLKLVKAAARRHGVKVTIVVDLIHVLEYLWKAAFALLGTGGSETSTASAERWTTQRLLEILRGRSSDVAAGMRRSATLRKLTPKQRAAVDTCADYLLKYRPYLRYDAYLSAGLPIATGVIEGACRHLVNDRMGITGASWSLRGAEAVLKLRSLMASHDLDEYWAFHEKAEWCRNHAAAYHGPPPPTIPPLKPTLRRHLTLVS